MKRLDGDVIFLCLGAFGFPLAFFLAFLIFGPIPPGAPKPLRGFEKECILLLSEIKSILDKIPK